MATMVKVWDLPTRIFHWTLVALFIFLIVSGDIGGDLIEWHFYAGYMLSGLLVFRLFWGIAGTSYARFSSFVRDPIHTLGYTGRMLRGNAEHHYGHNPAGGMMVIALIVLLALQVLSGLVTTDDILWDGPFYSMVSDETAELGGEIHETVQLILQIMVGLHVLAIIFHKVRYRDPLIPAMLHGNKPDKGNAVSRDSVRVVPFLLVVLLAVGWTSYLFSLPL